MSSPILESLLEPQHGHDVGRRVNDATARQVAGEVAPRRLAAHEALDPDAGALCLDLILTGCRGRFLEL
jgi:hypothetical protein